MAKERWRPPQVSAEFQKDFTLLKLRTGKSLQTLTAEAFRSYTLEQFSKSVNEYGAKNENE